MKNAALMLVSWVIAGVVTASHALITLVPPKLIPLARSAQLRKGERYHVTCSTSDGSPPLTFSWTKNGEIVSDGSEFSVRKLDDFSSSLVVESVHENHIGNYSCTAANAAGKDTVTTNLQVLYPPSWLRAPTDVTVTHGSKINLFCEANGSPKPVITWRRNTDFSAMNFEIIQADGRLRITEDGQIKIPEARKEDEGFYECHVANGVGDELRKTVRIEVQVPPKVSPGVGTLKVERGKDITVQCNMTGDPPLTVMWEKNGKPLESRKSKLHIQELPTDLGVTTSLILSSVDRGSSGLYVCKAKNSYGESHRIINLDVVEHPSNPKDLTVSQVWSRSVLLTWTLPYSGNRPITAYIIHYWKSEGKSEPPPDKTLTQRVPSLQTSAVVQDLLPNTVYSFFTLAENEVGLSPPSATVFVGTREEEPDWKPTELTVLEKHAVSVRLRWKCPQKKEWAVPLKGYYVGYQRISPKTAYTYRTLAVNSCSNFQEYVLQGLQRASSYYVIVKAYNDVGVGPESEAVLVHTADGGPPRQPHVKLLNTGGVTCSIKIWPRENSKNLPTAYCLYVQEQGRDIHKIFVPVHPSQNYSIGGLNPGRQYDIYVKAINIFGESGSSIVLKTVTDTVDPSLLELNTEPVYEQMYFIIPIVVSALIIIILPTVAWCCLNKPPDTESNGMEGLEEVQEFIYAAATIRRMEATLRRASASGTLPRPVPARLSSLPRPSHATTTTLPHPQPSTATVAQSSYSTLQNYGTVTVEEDSRYDSVVEEMRTMINSGATRPKKLIAEEERIVPVQEEEPDYEESEENQEGGGEVVVVEGQGNKEES